MAPLATPNASSHIAIVFSNRKLVATKGRFYFLASALSLVIYLLCCVKCQTSASQMLTLSPSDELQVREAQNLAREGAARFGKDVHYGVQETTCFRAIRDQYRPSKGGQSSFFITSVEWTELQGQIAKEMGHAMRWAKETVESIVTESENLASNHTFNKELSHEYNDVHYIEPSSDELLESSLFYPQAENQTASSATSDPDNASEPAEALPVPDSLIQNPDQSTQSEKQPPVRLLKLSQHPNFDETLVNTEESAVHVPVHLFFGEPQIMNGIAWSEGLTKVFRDNLVQNPTLTNQYFASQDGFLRLYPARKWPIPQSQPDLYDARMRPWYLAGASSRKDVVILVDSSGSMTGSRRDIAKGVVFEILDTLTDNDNFLILKFSDTIQQVGVPSCPGMRVERSTSNVPFKNTLFSPGLNGRRNENETDYGSFYLTQASGKNIRHIKSNFTIPTAGIANFSRALVTAFEVLNNYQQSSLSALCNQAIMLITDGAPSDFMDIFNRYNVPNAPVRVFTYLIGREAGDVTNTKMMACHNRGFYTHVINLAEVRETVQQYIPVMARPLVLSGMHPSLWTPAYGDLTYQILTDWVWESRRRDKARAIVGAYKQRSNLNGGNIHIINEESPPEDELDDPSIDLFGYDSNPKCFWQNNRNDLLTTVVQPVHDRRKETNVTEKFLYKNVWTIREVPMRTAKILGVAAVDMRINHLLSYAPSHKLGVNAYPILLTNNGFVMHHPDLRSILEPQDPSDKDMRILKPFFSSMDFTEVEHVLGEALEDELTTLRKEAVNGLAGLRTLTTKRMFDCQRRVQTRNQSFYYKPIDQFPFSFIIATPEYGSRRIDATIDIKTTKLREKLTTYFTVGDLEALSVHPDYKYCVGPSNNTAATLLDMLGRIDRDQTNDIQWKPPESTKPPIFLPGKIVCDKNLVESLVFDAVATFNFSLGSSPPNPSAESSLLGMFGVRFAFVSTRSGFLRVRYFDYDDDRPKKEALTFARKHNRGVDETFYSRTVDYNMLVNTEATLIQVPFNTFERIREKLSNHQQNMASDPDNINTFDSEGPLRFDADSQSLEEKLKNILTNSSLHVIATQSIIGEEGPRKAAAGVIGVFYDFATFALRFFKLANDRLVESNHLKPAACYNDNSTEACNGTQAVKCGFYDDDIDCLLVDNNGYIIVSEDLNFIGRSLKAYDTSIMQRLVNAGVYYEVNVTDYQAVCSRQEEKQQLSGAISHLFQHISFSSILRNFIAALAYTWMMFIKVVELAQNPNTLRPTLEPLQISSILPNKTYLRPCERVHTLYETRKDSPDRSVEWITSSINCSFWIVYEQVPNTNLIMLIVKLQKDEVCKQNLDKPWLAVAEDDMVENSEPDESTVCSKLERGSKLVKKKIDSCISHHPDEDNIKLCDSATSLSSRCFLVMALVSLMINCAFCRRAPIQ